MKLLKHASAIGRCFLLMMAIPAMAYATDQTEKSELQSLICTPKEASLITDKQSNIEERKYLEAKRDKFIFINESGKWVVRLLPVNKLLFTDCSLYGEKVFCNSNHEKPNTGEFLYQRKSDSKIVFTSFLTIIYDGKDITDSFMTKGYCKPFKN